MRPMLGLAEYLHKRQQCRSGAWRGLMFAYARSCVACIMPFANKSKGSKIRVCILIDCASLACRDVGT